MAATPEKLVKDKIKALLKTYGAYYRLDVKTGLATNGDPDFDVCHAGRFAGVEAKAGRGQPTALQYARLLEIQKAGGAAFIINETNLIDLQFWLARPNDRVYNGNLREWPNPLDKLL